MVASTAIAGRISPEQLLELPDGKLYELVDGELVEKLKMSMQGSEVAARLIIFIGSFLLRTKLGRVFGSDASYRCFATDPDRIRRPDASFIAAGRLSVEDYETGHCPIAPDLAIEVVSPHDLQRDVERKIEDYLNAGVQVVWVISPPTRSAMVYRLGRTERLHARDTLTAEDILPGFSVSLAEVLGTTEGLQPTKSN